MVPSVGMRGGYEPCASKRVFKVGTWSSKEAAKFEVLSPRIPQPCPQAVLRRRWSLVLVTAAKENS